MSKNKTTTYYMNPNSNYDFHGLIDRLEMFAEYEKIKIQITPVVEDEDE